MLYQRDRGELDSDARSITTQAWSDAASMAPGKGGFYADGRAGSPAPTLPRVPGYDNYLAHGSNHGHGAQQSTFIGSEIELTRMDSMDEQPLLPRGYGMMPPSQSQSSLPSYRMDGPPQSRGYPPQQQQQYQAYPPQAAQPYYQEAPGREASLHRPMPPSRQETSYMGGAGDSDVEVNMAGRGRYGAR